RMTSSNTNVMTVQIARPGSGFISMFASAAARSWSRIRVTCSAPSWCGLGLGREDDADDLGEQRDALDQCRRDDHSGAEVADALMLACRAVERRRRKLADADAGADDRETGTDAGGEVCESEGRHFGSP